jgi:hypothetical protein
MNRLQGELQRLYGSADAPDRVAVLELAGAGGWSGLARVWQGVQADLELPAPGIAVNGADAYQLWFSFADAASVGSAERLIDALRARYLPDVPPERIRINLQPAPMPPLEVGAERWSAFVTPDLAALFDEGPWLDLPPGVDAQAELLSRLQPIAAKDLARAMERLEPAPEATAPAPQRSEEMDPKRFLLQVMNDAGVDMHLRIEAAKALLQEGARR